MSEFKYTERQQREREFYEEFSLREKIAKISFEPVLGKEKRPWDSYWFVLNLSLKNFTSKEQKLLDFGCGNGVSSLKFAKIGYDVWGFDISPNNIAIAKNLAKRYRFEDRMHFSVKIAEQLDYPSEFFDIIVGINILHHVEIEQAIRECFRILKKDGIAIFREPIEIPIFDKIRNTQFGTWLASKGRSFRYHYVRTTKDERKLTTNPISIINEIFSKLSIRRFTFLSKLDELIRETDNKNTSFLQKFDHILLKNFPFLNCFGGTIVLIMQK